MFSCQLKYIFSIPLLLPHFLCFPPLILLPTDMPSSITLPLFYILPSLAGYQII